MTERAGVAVLDDARVDPVVAGTTGVGRERVDALRRWFTAARILRLGLAGVVTLAAAIATRRLGAWFTDDAFITMRFADNLVSGDGWTYNVGEDTANGATSPAFTVAVGVLSLPLRAATRASALLFVASFGAIAWFLAGTFKGRDELPTAVLTPALLLGCPVVLAMKGMEALPFLALICAVLWAASTERDVALGVAAALLVLTRGEGAFLVAVVGGQLLWQRRCIPWRTIAAGTAVAVPWVVYSLATFGTVFPDTLSAKIAQRESGYWGQGWLFLRGFTQIAEPLNYERWLWVVIPLAVAGLVRGCADHRLRPAVVPLVAATLLHFLAYGLVLNVPWYHWYYAWELFTLALLAALVLSWGMQQLVTTAARRHRPAPAQPLGDEALAEPTRRPRPAIGRTLAASALGAAALAALVVAVIVPAEPSTDPRYYLENQSYMDLGVWLRDNTPADARIAATEIGALGWYSERTIVDYLGLLDETSIEEVRRGDLQTWLEREQPDYWVVHEPLWPHEVAATLPAFAEHYRPIHATATNPAGHRMVVYQRQPA